MKSKLSIEKRCRKYFSVIRVNNTYLKLFKVYISDD